MDYVYTCLPEKSASTILLQSSNGTDGKTTSIQVIIKDKWPSSIYNSGCILTKVINIFYITVVKSSGQTFKKNQFPSRQKKVEMKKERR